MKPQREPQEVLRFRSRPGHIVGPFLLHVRDTGSPETFSDITNTPTRNLEGVDILTKFVVDRKKRPELDAVPCPVCSPNAPKYLHGYLVYFPNELCIRAIGQECGKHIDAEFAKKAQALKTRERNDQTVANLESQLPRIPAMILEAQELTNRLNHQKQLWASFRRKCPSIAQLLRSEMGLGVLSVAIRNTDHQRSFSSGKKDAQFTSVRIGSVVGNSFVKHDFKHDKDLRDTLPLLHGLDQGENPENIFLSICDLTTKEQTEIERAIVRAKKRISNAIRLLEDFRLFYAESNVDIINRWANEPTAPMNFKLEFHTGTRRLKVQSRENGTEYMDFFPDKM